MKLERIEAASAPSAVGGYAQAIGIRGYDRLVFVSGQIPMTKTGDVPPDFESQARLVWANVRAQLAAAGLTVTNIVKVTTFLASREHADLNAAVRRDVLGGHEPSLTVIIADIFDPAWLLEIEVIAAA